MQSVSVTVKKKKEIKTFQNTLISHDYFNSLSRHFGCSKPGTSVHVNRGPQIVVGNGRPGCPIEQSSS